MKKGTITLTIGPMFAGKTTWLIEKLKEYDKNKILLIKYFKDTRYEVNYIVTHDGKKLKATSAKDSNEVLEIFKNRPDLEILGLDELQFFDSEISEVFEKLKDEGINIFVSGLNVDHNNKIWDSTKSTSQIADIVNNLVAVCARCGRQNATITFRKGRKEERIVIGGAELYESLCVEDYRKAVSR